MIPKLLENINIFLAPLEKVILQYRKHIGYFLIILSGGTIFLLLNARTIRFTGEQSLNILWIILFLPILARVFLLQIAQVLMPLRKELGILMGMLALVHSVQFFLVPWSYIPDFSWLIDPNFWTYKGIIAYTGAGLIATILTLLLLFTSNTFSVKLLGKNWKRLHRIVYIIAIFTILHVVLLRWDSRWRIDYGEFTGLIIYFIGKALEWKWVSFWNRAYQKWKKWICPPCWYIYDPEIGDIDSGILPGTDFADIPNTWKCPICGVAKSDFILYEDEVTTEIETKATQITCLNPSTIELIIETVVFLQSKPGQFVSFHWQDEEGMFVRSYSIAEAEGNSFTFLIKLSEPGRWTSVLKSLKVWETIRIRGVFGKFLLQETENPKIFIATGTGLAPIYNMILHVPTGVWKVLYFTVANSEELFYIEKLKSIPNLELHIHTTKEQVEGYEFGRVNVDDIQADENTEWYLCGNPRMVTETKEKLANHGFTSIYSEEF